MPILSRHGAFAICHMVIVFALKQLYCGNNRI